MFTNRKDPLVDAVKSVMSEGNLKRQVEEAVNNHFGVSSRKAIPHEHLAEYDALLSEAYKCAMEEEKPISHPNQKIISKQDGKPESISGEDFKILRKKKESGIAIKQEETQLDEKATEAQKEKVAKVMHKWKQGKEHIGKSKETVPVTKKGQKQAVAIALSQAGLSKKKQMDESIESIMEEIRVNLEEQLIEAYEAGTEVFENFVNSLNEEQLELLGLNEVFGDVFGGTGSSERQSILDRASQQTYSNRQRQAAGQRTVSAARPAPSAAPAARSAPTGAPAARSAAPAARSAAQGVTNQMRTDSDAERSSQGGSTYKATDTASRTAPREPAPGTNTNKGSADYNSENIPVNPISSNKEPGFLRPNREAPSVKPENIPLVGAAPTGTAARPAPATPNNPERASERPGARMPAPVTGQPPAGSSQYKGAEAGGRADLTAPEEKPKKPAPTNLGNLNIPESTHIRESLESFIRNKFIKG